MLVVYFFAIDDDGTMLWQQTATCKFQLKLELKQTVMKKKHKKIHK